MCLVSVIRRGLGCIALIVLTGSFLGWEACDRTDKETGPLPVVVTWTEALLPYVRQAEQLSIATGLETRTMEQLVDSVAHKEALWALTPKARCHALIRWFYEEQKMVFCGNGCAKTAAFPQTALSTKAANCIGATSLLLLLSEKMDVPLFPVLLPGHIFLRYDDGQERFNIEPNRSGYAHPDSYYVARYATTAQSFYDLHHLSPSEFAGVVRYEMGNQFRNKGQLQEALQAYRAAFHYLPGYAEAYGNGALVLDALGKSKQALVLLQKAELYNSQLPMLSRNMAILLWKTHQKQAARPYLERALAEQPGDSLLQKLWDTL